MAETPEFVVAGIAGRNERNRIRSVDIYIDSVRAGKAELKRRPGRLSFEFRTGAPAGTRTITVCGRTTSGRVVSASVVVTVVWPAPDDEAVVDPDVRVLSETQTEAIKAITPTSVTFSGRRSFTPGDVLVGHGPTAPEGLLRRVTDVRSVGRDTVVRTSQASITDVFLQAQVHETVPLAAVSSSSTPDKQKKVRSKTEAKATSPTFELSRTLLEREVGGVDLSLDGSVSAAGSLSLVVDLDLDFGLCNFKPCSKVNTVEFRLEGSVTTAGELAVSAKKDLIDFNVDLPFPKVTVAAVFPVGVVPVVVTGEIEFEVGARASVGLRRTFSWESTRFVSVGALWDKDTGFDAFHSIGSSGSDIDRPDQETQIFGDADVFFTPEFEIMLYGILGPTFELETGYHWELSAGLPNPCPGEFKRGPYIEPSIEFELELFNVEREWSTQLGRASALTESPLPWCSSTAPLQVRDRTLPDGTSDVAYDAALQAEGGKGPYQWDVIAGSLPDGLTLDRDGRLRGTPSRSGTYTFRVLVHDADAASAEAELTVKVNPPLPPIEPGEGGEALPVVLSCRGACAVSWGDPHLTTFDGLAYDSQLVGEFVLARSTSDDLEVQVRQQPWGSSRIVSVNTAAGVRIAGRRLEVEAGVSGPVVLLDGQAVPYSGTLSLGGGASVETSADGRRVTAAWPDGSFAAMDYQNDDRTPYLSLSVGLAPARAGLMVGLLGDGDGSTANDFVARSGDRLDVDPAPSVESVRAFANSWRITAAESLFTYRGGESTASFTDLSFPYGSIAVDDLPEQQRAAAREACVSAGVRADEFLDACVLDVAVTGDTGAASVAATAEGGADLVDVVSAAEVTPAISPTSVPSDGYVFLDRSFRVSMRVGSRLVLSSQPDGTGDVHVDDRIQIDVTREDGTTATFARGFEFSPPAAPLDLTSSLANGANVLRVRLMDTVGGAYASTPLYLVVVK